MMCWLLDQGLPQSTARLLREQDLDVVHVGEIGMAFATDREILLLTERQNRILVTLDADFHALLATSGASRPSVVRIREEGLKAEDVAKLILLARLRFSEALQTGCVLTLTATKARLRMLPIHP